MALKRIYNSCLFIEAVFIMKIVGDNAAIFQNIESGALMPAFIMAWIMIGLRIQMGINNES